MFKLLAHGYAAHLLVYFPTRYEAETEKHNLIRLWGFNRETISIEEVV